MHLNVNKKKFEVLVISVKFSQCKREILSDLFWNLQQFLMQWNVNIKFWSFRLSLRSNEMWFPFQTDICELHCLSLWKTERFLLIFSCELFTLQPVCTRWQYTHPYMEVQSDYICIKMLTIVLLCYSES